MGSVQFLKGDRRGVQPQCLDFETLEAARTFKDSTRLREVMSEAGVAGEPTIWFTTLV